MSENLSSAVFNQNIAHSQTWRKTPNLFPEIYIFVVTTFLGEGSTILWQPFFTKAKVLKFLKHIM